MNGILIAVCARWNHALFTMACMHQLRKEWNCQGNAAKMTCNTGKVHPLNSLRNNKHCLVLPYWHTHQFDFLQVLPTVNDMNCCKPWGTTGHLQVINCCKMMCIPLELPLWEPYLNFFNHLNALLSNSPYATGLPLKNSGNYNLDCISNK